MNIGLVSPYDFATQGGVTEHITHLSKELRAAGHTVKILAPYSAESGDIPDDVYALGAVTPVPANGSVASGGRYVPSSGLSVSTSSTSTSL
jgi:phosphatidylinositol alpha-mannosyltransferase